MKIAVITGASSGLGEKYALEIAKERKEIEEIWLVARRLDRLEKLGKSLNKPYKALALDITKSEDLERYADQLRCSNAQVQILINNAGYGKLGAFDEISTESNAGMVRLNCEALVTVTSLTIPFMPSGSEILHSCSIASFAPNIRMAVYSATKAFVMSFSRALRSELRPKGINSIAVCPGPMDTEFLSLAGIEKGTSRTFDTLPRVNPQIMAKKSLKASAKGRSVYTDLVFYKFYRILAKLLPHSLVMKMAAT